MRSLSSRATTLDAEIGDPDAPIGSRQWALWVVGQAEMQAKRVRDDVAWLQRLLTDLESGKAWSVLGFLSLEALSESKIGIPGHELAAIRSAKPNERLGDVIARANSATPLAGHGEIGGGHTEGRDNIVISDRQGNSAAYLTRRIARDRPDILERMKAGEFKSVRAAAIEAGIVKVKSAGDQLRHWWSKAAEEERKSFLDFVLNS